MMSTPQEASDQTSTTLSASQWEAFRPILQQKYERENLTLEVVREYMREAHKFSASRSQYQRAFNKWGFRKNTKRRDAEEIIVSAKRRKLSLSQVTLERASLQEQERFQRSLRRYDTPGLPYNLQKLEPRTNRRNLNNERPLSWGDEDICLQKDKVVVATPMLHIMPHINLLPTLSLISHLGWRLPESPSLLLPKTSLSLLTIRGTSLKLSRRDTQEGSLNLDSIVFTHQILNHTLNNTTAVKLFSFIVEGSMDLMLRYMCRSSSYIAKAFIKNLLSRCFKGGMLGMEYRPLLNPVLQKLLKFGVDGNIAFPTPWSLNVNVDRCTIRRVTLLQSAIGLRLFDLATDLLQGGADVNLCGTHGRFTDYRQLRCCEMLPIALLLEYSIEDITEEIEAARLLTAMQKTDLVCCQALCLTSVATHYCLSWFLTKPGVDLNAPHLAQAKHFGDHKTHRWLSPLHSAIDQSEYEIVSMLLEAGAHPSGHRLGDLRNSCTRGRDQCVHYIGPSNGISELQSSTGITSPFELYVAMPPLSVACLRGDFAIVRLLLSKGASINGCQLDIHCQENLFLSGMRNPICQPCRNHSCYVTQCQSSLDVRNLLPFRRPGNLWFDPEKDVFTELQPWKELSKLCDKRQLDDYSVYFGHSALHLAVVTSQEDLVLELIHCGADIEGCHGLTPLALAICVGNASLVDMLLGYGADPRGLSKHGPLISPFAVAAYLNDVANMKKLMATGRISSYEVSLRHELCPWEAAVRGKSCGATSYLLSLQFSSKLSWDTGNAASLIDLAMRWSEWSLVQAFLDRWGHLLSMNQMHDLLFQSIKNADLAVTTRLMALGVSLEDVKMLEAALRLDLEDAQHQRSFIAFILQSMSEAEPGAIIRMIETYFHGINDNALKDVIEYLNAHYPMTAADTSDLLAILLFDGEHGDAALCLLKNGMYVERSGEQAEMTGLQYAAQTDNLGLVRRLLQLGADVNTNAAAHPSPCENAGAMTALQFAIFNGQIKTAKLLLDNGAHINAQGDRAVLQVSSEDKSFDPDMIHLLLERGADVNAVGADEKYDTALQRATLFNQTDIAKILLDNGAHVNAPAHGRFGRTALQAAVEMNNPVLFRLFLDKGADVNAPPAPHGGVTALQAAAIIGDLEICHTLIAAGANVDADRSAKHGRTAIEGAAEHGRLDVLSWLLHILVSQYRGQDPERFKASIRRAKKFAKQNRQDYIVQFLEEFGETLDQKLL